MLVRDVPRKDLMLFIIARNHPASDLIPVQFLTKKDFIDWKRALEEAIQTAPPFGNCRALCLVYFQVLL